jgi:hypothetical protein
MKHFLIALNIVIWSFVGYQATAYAEPAKKPTVQKKQIKKHKKVEGTRVPEKAPAKSKSPAKK